jgi:hypothetical protein
LLVWILNSWCFVWIAELVQEVRGWGAGIYISWYFGWTDGDRKNSPNFGFITYVSLRPVEVEFFFLLVDSVQGDCRGDGKVGREGYWWLAQSLQHLRYTRVVGSSGLCSYAHQVGKIICLHLYRSCIWYFHDYWLLKGAVCEWIIATALAILLCLVSASLVLDDLAGILLWCPDTLILLFACLRNQISVVGYLVICSMYCLLTHHVL